MSDGSIIFDTETGKFENYEEKYVPQLRKRSCTESEYKKLVEYLVFGQKQTMGYIGVLEFNVEDIEFMSKFVLGTKKDILFFSKALVFARQYGVHNDLITFGLVILSASPHPYAKEIFLKIFNKVALDFDDIRNFLDVVKLGVVRGFGKLIQKALRGWLVNITGYEGIKYSHSSLRSSRDLSGNRRMDEFKIGDVIKLAHARPVSSQQSDLFKWLISGKVDGLTNLPEQVKAFSRFTHINHGAERTEILNNNFFPISLIRDISPSITPENAINVFMGANFEEIMDNFNWFRSRRVFTNERCLKKMAKILKNQKTIENSGYFPYHFVIIYDIFSRDQIPLLAETKQAIEYSYASVPSIEKKVLICADQGIDSYTPTWGNGTDANKMIEALTIMLAKSFYKATIIPFSKTSAIHTIDKSKDTITLLNNMREIEVGNQTDYVQLFKFIIDNNLKFDQLIFLNARPKWHQLLLNSEAGNLLSNYLNSVNTQTEKMTFLSLSEEEGSSFRHSLSNCTFFFGWHKGMIKYLYYTLTLGNIDLLQKVSDTRI